MLIVSREQIEQMKFFSERAYPEECTGILLGKAENQTRRVTEIISLTNTAQKPEIEFAVSDIELLKAEKYAVSKDLDVVGFYHSHADFEAVLSEKDRKSALPGLSYPIFQVEKGIFKALKSYAFTGDTSKNFSEEEIVCL